MQPLGAGGSALARCSAQSGRSGNVATLAAEALHSETWRRCPTPLTRIVCTPVTGGCREGDALTRLGTQPRLLREQCPESPHLLLAQGCARRWGSWGPKAEAWKGGGLKGDPCDRGLASGWCPLDVLQVPQCDLACTPPHSLQPALSSAPHCDQHHTRCPPQGLCTVGPFSLVWQGSSSRGLEGAALLATVCGRVSLGGGGGGRPPQPEGPAASLSGLEPLLHQPGARHPHRADRLG